MTYSESLQYLETNLDNLVEASGRHSKLPKLDGKCYINPLDMKTVIQALTTASSKPIHKKRIQSIATDVKKSI